MLKPYGLPLSEASIARVLATPTVQTALAEVRKEGVAIGAAYAFDPATPKPEPVLRWEGSELWLGEEPVAWVDTFRSGETEWNCTLANVEGDAPTLTEARTAAEQAVRDWLKRAGCV